MSQKVSQLDLRASRAVRQRAKAPTLNSADLSSTVYYEQMRSVELLIVDDRS